MKIEPEPGGGIGSGSVWENERYLNMFIIQDKQTDGKRIIEDVGGEVTEEISY